MGRMFAQKASDAQAKQDAGAGQPAEPAAANPSGTADNNPVREPRDTVREPRDATREPRAANREPRDTMREPRDATPEPTAAAPAAGEVTPEQPADSAPASNENWDNGEIHIIEDRGGAQLATQNDQYLVRMDGDSEWTVVDLEQDRNGMDRTVSSLAAGGNFATDAVRDADGGYRLLWERKDPAQPEGEVERFFEWKLNAQGEAQDVFLTPANPNLNDGVMSRRVSTTYVQGLRAADNPDAPTFESAKKVKFDENGTGPAYVAQATSKDGGAVTYALGGADASRFEIDENTGEVTFKDTPDFEAPADGNLGNNYDLTVTATDSDLRQTTQDVTILVRDVREQGDPTGKQIYAGINGTADAAGTQDDPLSLEAAIEQAGENGIISLEAGTYDTQGFILKEGQVLLGAGATDPISGVTNPNEGETIINGTSSVQGVVGLGQRSEVYGVTATGGINNAGIIADVAHVFLITGQSNASGHAFNSAAPDEFFEGDVISNAHIWEDNRDGDGANEFQALSLENSDGIEFNGQRHPNNNPDNADYQHGVEIYQARGLQDQLGDDDFYIVKLAQGSAPISNWEVGGDFEHGRRLASETQEAASAIAEDGSAPFISGLTWLQGENNGGLLAQGRAEIGEITPIVAGRPETEGGNYARSLYGVFQDLGSNLGVDIEDVPIAIPQLDTAFVAGDRREPGYLTVNADQRAVANVSDKWVTITTGFDENGEDLTPQSSRTSDASIHHGTADFDYIGGETVKVLNPNEDRDSTMAE